METTFWLSTGEWTAIAAIAQGLAAVGALALLLITWLSQRDARDAIESSRALARHTEQLVLATKSEQELSVRPMIQVTLEPHERRLRLTNKGNGPLLGPRVELNRQDLALVSDDVATSSYVQTAAFAVTETAFALLPETEPLSGEVLITGLTLTGGSFSARLDSKDFGTRTALVARSD
jgi:hypothetical protein